MLKLLSSPFKPTFDEFLGSLSTTCFICSPYITSGPMHTLVQTVVEKGIQNSLAVNILTDISTPNIVQGVTDVDALLYLTEHLRHVEITYLPRIHAKVYISGETLAIVGSANFTDGGASRNMEYGISVMEPTIVQQIQQDMTQYAKLGGRVTSLRLIELRERIASLRQAVHEEQRSIRQKLRLLSAELERKTQDDLIRIRVEGRSANAIFSETILYLLSKRALTTVALNEAIQEIHPDLCDDTTDRVIDGKHYGKLWKHQVRGAQVTLRRQGRVEYDADRRVWYRLDGKER